MALYTRSGDEGRTALYGGERSYKDDIRLEAVGTIDELNTFLGLAVSLCEERETSNLLQHIQNDLFTLQAELASLSPSLERPPHCITHDHVLELEQHINRIERQVPAQKSFIIPGGNQLAATLQVCRTVARRAERRIVTLSKERRVSPDLMHYANRLSDLLHILSRLANRAQDEKPPVYQKEKPKEDQATL